MEYKKMWHDTAIAERNDFGISVPGESKTRSGLALTAKQMFDKVMSNQGSTALITTGDQYDRDASSPDDFGSDERELATKFQEVTQAKKKASDKLKETVKKVAQNAEKIGIIETSTDDSE